LESRLKRGKMTEEEVKVILREFLMGYGAVVEERFVHGGIKLSSVMLKDGSVRVGGFGNARKINRPDIVR
jgi:hypothetical protein